MLGGHAIADRRVASCRVPRRYTGPGEVAEWTERRAPVYVPALLGSRSVRPQHPELIVIGERMIGQGLRIPSGA